MIVGRQFWLAADNAELNGVTRACVSALFLVRAAADALSKHRARLVTSY